ncbi:MAG: hypothetical protein L0Y71_17070 [Gemmataceae bacterium]|nr:hypothetical protein [Gemmataceae bacterium]
MQTKRSRGRPAKADRRKATAKKSIKEPRLVAVRFARPSTLQLTFADRAFSLPTAKLGMPKRKIRWSTVAVRPTGDAMTVRAIRGETVAIDSGTLRYLVDRDYAAAIDRALDSLGLTAQEMDRMVRDNPPPPDWYATTEPDLRLESWK